MDDDTTVKIGIFISDLTQHTGKRGTGYKSVSVHLSEVREMKTEGMLHKCHIHTCKEGG